MSTSLIIDFTNSADKKKQKSITDINPNASTTELLDFSQTLISLTNNSYQKTTRIDKTDLDTSKPTRPIATGGPAMLYINDGNKYFNLSATPQVSVPKSQLPVQNECLTIQLYAQTPLDSMMQVIDLKATGSWQVTNYQYQNPISTTTAHQWRLVIQGPNATDTDVVSFTIHFDETSEYAAYDLPVKITITEG